MFYGFYDPTVILIVPAMIFTIYAQTKVKSAYSKYSQVRNRRGMTGLQAARRILDANGLQHVPVEITPGELSDHYDPKADVMRLSSAVGKEATIAAVSIAAHEAGHAIQDDRSYALLSFRNAIAPLTSVVSVASWPLILIGFLAVGMGYIMQGNFLLNLGIVLFLVVILFHLVTLPVELNASRRAIVQLAELGIIYEDEKRGARKVLSAAALTYVAALASAVLTLIRLLLIRGRN